MYIESKFTWNQGAKLNWISCYWAVPVQGYLKIRFQRKQTPVWKEAISAVRWPIFRTKSSNVKKEEKRIIYQRKCIYGPCAYKSCGNSVLWLMLYIFVNQFIPPNFAVLHRLRPAKFAVPRILLYTSLRIGLYSLLVLDIYSRMFCPSLLSEAAKKVLF